MWHYSENISLLSLDVDGLKTFWHPPIDTMLSPKYQFVIRHYPFWKKNNIFPFQYSSKLYIFHCESGIQKNGNKYHQMPNKITHLNKAEGSFLVEKYLSTKEKRGIPSRSRYNSLWWYSISKQYKYKNWFFYSCILQIHMEAIILSSTLVCIRVKTKTMCQFLLIWSFPVKAIVSRGLYQDPNVFRELYMDNCDSAPEHL